MLGHKEMRADHDFWKSFNLVSRVFSWIRLLATDNHNRYNKTIAFRISDQNKSLYLISLSCINWHL